MPIDDDAERRADKNRDWTKFATGPNGAYAITLRFVSPSKPNTQAGRQPRPARGG